MWRALISVTLLAAGLNSTACGPAAREVERTAAKRLVGKSAAKAARSGVVARDAWRDLFTPIRRLEKPRSVFRYMSEAEARAVGSRGVAAGRHFTATAGPGRPLGGARAAERYGLPTVPSRRVTATLPAGTRVKANKVLGGARGVGELKVLDPVAKEQVKAPVRLPR
jgi:hypothetical protein